MDDIPIEKPPCKRCKTAEFVRKKGFWTFNKGNPREQKLQRWHCTNPVHGKNGFHFHVEKRKKKMYHHVFVMPERYNDD